MLRILLFIMLFLPAEIFSQQLSKQQMRDLLVVATEHKLVLDSLLNILESIDNKTPTEESYCGICYGLCCNYDEGNWAKLKHVIKSKNCLNNAVERDPKNPELRFMRFMLEHFLPSFLGFNKHIPDDLKVVFANPTFIDDNPRMKKMTIDFLLWTKRCTPEQTKLLEAQLVQLTKKM